MLSGVRYPHDTRIELLNRFGCIGENGNFTIVGEYHYNLIKTIGKFIQPHHHTEINQYSIWYCNFVRSWRLVFGSSKVQ